MRPPRASAESPRAPRPPRRPARWLFGALLGALLALALATPAAAQRSHGITRAVLPRDTLIDGIPCGATGRLRAEFHAGGRLAECPLARPFALRGHAFGAGTWLGFTADGLLDYAWLARDTELQDIPCKGTGYQGWSVRFHPDGRLRLCYLARNAVIEGVPCIRGSFWIEVTSGGRSAVHLHPDGRLRQCQLSRAVTIDGVAYRSRALLRR
jgi:hypothetical protein